MPNAGGTEKVHKGYRKGTDAGYGVLKGYTKGTEKVLIARSRRLSPPTHDKARNHDIQCPWCHRSARKI